MTYQKNQKVEPLPFFRIGDAVKESRFNKNLDSSNYVDMQTDYAIE